MLDKVGGIIYAHLIDGETEALPNEVVSPKLECMPQHVCVLFPTLLEMVQAEQEAKLTDREVCFLDNIGGEANGAWRKAEGLRVQPRAKLRSQS